MMRHSTRLLGMLILAGIPSVAAAFGETSRSVRPDDPVVQFINEEIRQGWEDNEVEPSPRADDAEWLRRVYIDIAGHIPPAERIDPFLNDTDPAKRSKLIEELLGSRDYVRNTTEHWLNVLIGRRTPRRTSRPALRKFLQDSFAANRPWNDIVYDLLTAEGHYEEQGAANFLLAQLDGNPNREDYHVEATARVTRVFLGQQVQCTQCHNHPFNDWKQNQFWEISSFLKQVRRVDHRKLDPETMRQVDDFSELVARKFEGPVYFEMRNGLMQVAYPTYQGAEIDPKSSDRRLELAKLMCKTDPGHELAKAMVNRTWGYFFGYGFTRPIDDMGPHNPASHPAVLDRLTEEFVASGYDMKQLARWICNTEAYNLTSRGTKKNAIDDPAAGEVPLFSHMYVKTLAAEQLYDSLIVATNAHRSGAADDGEAEAQRERWLRDFLNVFGGNEDDEPTLFSGSIPQSLLMMNGPLVTKAIDGKPGSYLHTVLSDSKYRNDNARVQALYLATLGRRPERGEMAQLNRLLKGQRDPLAAYQDLYWALLNSNEFIVNH